MRLTERVSLVGSGYNGLGLTNSLDCNVYVVDCGDGLLLIDTGVGLGQDAILRQIRQDGYRPEDIRWIVLTHAHADHAAGIATFRALSGAEVFADEHEASVMEDQSLLDSTMDGYIRAGFYPSGYRLQSIHVDRKIRDGEHLAFGDVSLQAIVAPGHTGGGLCLHGQLEDKRTLFSGDVVFWNGMINLISIFDTDLLLYKKSILRLAEIPVDAMFAGHLQPVMNGASDHIRLAAEQFQRFSVPKSIC